MQNSVYLGRSRVCAGLFSLLLTSVVVLVAPVAGLFGMIAIGIEEYLVALALGFAIIPIVELGKMIHRIADKRHS